MASSLNISAIYMRMRAGGASDGVAMQSARVVQALMDNKKSLSLLRLPVKSLALKDMVKLDNPYGAAALFSSVMVDKALILAGVVLPDEKAACARAIAAVASDAVGVGVAGATGVGIPAAALLAISTSVDVYDMQQKCFIGEHGQVSHALYLQSSEAGNARRGP